MLDAGLHHAAGGQRACSVQPLPSRRLLIDTSPAKASLNIVHGAPDHVPSVSSTSLPVPLSSRPRSAPPVLPIQDMTGRLSRPETSPCGGTFHDEHHDDANPATVCDTTLPRRHARGTQVSPRELPQDPQLQDHYDGDQGPPVTGLSELFRTNKEHAQACAATKARLCQLSIGFARTSRLVHSARSVQHTLAECLRTEDKPGFLALFDTFHDALSNASTPIESNADTAHGLDAVEYPISFIDSLSADCRNAVLSLIKKVKCDSEYLADRLCTFTQSELTVLLPQRALVKSNDSVLGASQRTSSSLPRYLEALERQKERLYSYEYGSPLETLVLSTRTASSGSLQDDFSAIEVWAQVSARLIAKQRAGSDKFVPALVDLWKSCSPWPGKDRLELWILQTLHAGGFLLEKPASQTFQMRVQGGRDNRLEDELRRETFYTQASDSLLDLLGESTASSVIPEGAIRLCAAIHDKLKFSPGHRSAFPSFIATRWLVASFLPDAVTFPEMYGMATDRYISEQARTRILREVVNRARRTILDVVYSSKFGGRLTPQTVSRVATILKRFQARTTMDQSESNTPKAKAISRPAEPISPEFVMLLSDDIITIVNALYPTRRPASLYSDYDVASSVITSSASSVSGFSLFRNAHASNLSPAVSSPGSTDMFGLPVPWPLNTENSSFSFAGEDISPPSESSSDEELLRSACKAIDDFVENAAQPEVSEWAILMVSKDPTMRSIREELAQFAVCSTTADSVSTLSSEYNSCKAALEALLDDSEEDKLSLSSLIISGQANDMIKDVLVDNIHQALEHRRSRAELQSDFLTAYSWFQRLQNFQLWTDSGASAIELTGLIHDLASQAQMSTTRSLKITKLFERWLNSLGSIFGRSLAALTDFETASKQLRNKMWYAADVRVSSAYDEVRSIASALLVMGKPKLPSSARFAPPLRHSLGSKMIQTPFHLKTEAQILEILSASPKHGGPNKLSDDQTRALSTWMENNHIENLCRGEERLHKLYMEVRKCIDRVFAGGPNNEIMPLWSWSNPLFALDARVHASKAESTVIDPYSMLRSNFEHIGLRKMRSDISVSSMSIDSRPLSSRSSKDFLDARSPTWTNRSSAPFWSPATTEAQTFSCATSIIGSVRAKRTPRRIASSRKGLNATKRNYEEDFMQQLRQHVTSLLLSDLTTSIFNYGSETDRAFWTGLGRELADRHMRNILPDGRSELHEPLARRQFQFTKAYRRLMSQFSYSACPFAKLGFLHDIDALIERQHGQMRKEQLANAGFQSQMQEVISYPTVGFNSISDIKIDGFRLLFSDSTIRPATIFRDLQLIAALVPSHTLENTPQGKSFWNAAVAISGLKQEIRNIMVETADSIIAYQSNNRGQQHQSTASAAQQERDSATFAPPARAPSAGDITRYTMADAAYLLQITAKEGDPVAQRELATLYLTHPELMGHIIAPFTRPRDVFKEELENKWRKNQDPTRCDPATMCVAHHWMSLSSKGGDALAKEYLRQREEMDRLP